MLNATVLGLFSGFAIFLSGVHGYRYMRARVLAGVLGSSGDSIRISDSSPTRCAILTLHLAEEPAIRRIEAAISELGSRLP